MTVKHRKSLRVHQYVGKGHPGLNTDVQETIKSQEALNLFDSATTCGLKKIYNGRGKVTNDVRKDIDNATQRIWLLGVGLSEKLGLVELLPTLEQKIKDVDVRILLLHALSIPALVRTFLEITPKAFQSIIASIDRKPPSEPYFEQQLYRSFRTTTSELNNHTIFNAAVRFYRHTPICWLVIVDDKAYFQPYTFGRGKTYTPDNLTLGPLMPVFKFHAQPNTDNSTFDILEDHFNKLWITSNTDLLHLGAHMISRGDILRDLYSKHRAWFKLIFGELLELKQGILPELGATVTLKIQPVGGYEEAAKHLKKEILDPSGGKFKVMRIVIENRMKLIALRADTEQ